MTRGPLTGAIGACLGGLPAAAMADALGVSGKCVAQLSLVWLSAGAHNVDEHFRTAPFEDNIPVMLGLTGVWNTTFLGYPSLAILPYTQALSKLAPHIQQVSYTYSAARPH